MNDKFQKRLSKRSRKGFRGWPLATIAFYGPDLNRASKVTVGIIHTEAGEVAEMRSWHSDATDVRIDAVISQEIAEFIDYHGAKSVSMVDRIIGCPHQEGVDYQGDWCPVCDFWKGRDRFTGSCCRDPAGNTTGALKAFSTILRTSYGKSSLIRKQAPLHQRLARSSRDRSN